MPLSGRATVWVPLDGYWKGINGQVWKECTLPVSYSSGLNASDCMTAFSINTSGMPAVQIATYRVDYYIKFRGL